MTRIRNKAAASPVSAHPTDPRQYLAEEPRRLVEGLTPRQRAMLIMIAREFDQHLLADAMGISVSTVKVHRADLYRRLGVETAVGATVVAFGAGLVS